MDDDCGLNSQPMGRENQWDPEFAAMWPQLESKMAMVERMPVETLRLAGKQPRPLPDGTPTAYGTICLNISVGDDSTIELKLYIPSTVEMNRPFILMMHSGGWTIGSHTATEPLSQELCVSLGAVVASVDYRLAPEHPFPIPVNDCFAALTWAISNAEHLAIDPQKIFLAGSSAGANLAAAVALRARDEGLNGLIGQILLSPALCHPDLHPSSFCWKSLEENKTAPILTAASLRDFWNNYLPNRDELAYASPILSESLQGLPSTFILTCGLDPLHDDGVFYADLLKNADIHVLLKEFNGLPHDFYSILPGIQASKRAKQDIINWAKVILQK